MSKDIKAEVQRLRDEQNRLRRIKEGFPSEVEQILYQEAWNVMGKSVKVAPIDTGRLRASARVDLPVREGNEISINLSYNTDYAKYVHDRNAGGFPVNYRAPNTQSLFLINPIMENLEEMEDRIRVRLERMVARNAG